ncbi:MAG: acetaldehyde dehydrogenase, partial [Ignavibacteriaceae bacterium]
IDLLNFGGVGHTMVIHSNDQPIIMKFALEKPAFRVLVNTVGSLGAVGSTTALDPSMTLGPGTWGGSIISDNVTAKHLINIKSLAFETNPVNEGKSVTQFDVQRTHGTKDMFMSEIEERLKARAGNPPLRDSYQYNIVKEPEIKNDHPKPKTKVSFGKGISEEKILKIIEEFERE